MREAIAPSQGGQCGHCACTKHDNINSLTMQENRTWVCNWGMDVRYGYGYAIAPEGIFLSFVQPPVIITHKLLCSRMKAHMPA